MHFGTRFALILAEGKQPFRLLNTFQTFLGEDKMIVSVPKEIKNQEYRVGITPAGVKALADAGHKVLVEKNAGTAIGITDADYIAAGAQMVDTAAEAWSGDMVVKVKEPLAPEYQYFREGMVLFTYLHLAAEPELTKALLEKKVTAIAYETVQLPNRQLPLLAPMSEVAGRMAAQVGAQLLTKREGGMGLLMGGTAGVPAANFVVVGAGVVGFNAAKVAVGMGAKVTILDVNIARLREIDDLYGNRIQTIYSNALNVAHAVKDADVVVGSVLIPGAATPQLVTEEMVKSMKPGSVIVDVAIDQGGAVQTTAKHGATSHDNPTFITENGVVCYCVGNMPGAVARTSTFTLTNATLPYMVKLANKGWKEACKTDEALAKGLNTHDGKVFFKGVCDKFGMECHALSEVL